MSARRWLLLKMARCADWRCAFCVLLLALCAIANDASLATCIAGGLSCCESALKLASRTELRQSSAVSFVMPILSDSVHFQLRRQHAPNMQVK